MSDTLRGDLRETYLFSGSPRRYPERDRATSDARASASSRGCQSKEIVISGVGTGRGKLYIPARRFPVCRSGTLATRSEARASASAVEKSLTIVTISRSSPNGFKASSIGPVARPRRETLMCRPLAYRAGVIAPWLSACPMRTTPMNRSRTTRRHKPPDQSSSPPRLSPDRRFRRERCAFFVWFLHEAEPHARRLRADARNEIRPEVLNKAVAGPNRERPDQLFEVELLSRTEHRCCILNELTDLLAKFERARCGTRPRGSDQQGIAGRSRKRASARLIADGLSRNRWAARATLPSASTASSVRSKLKSGVDMQ